jgi:hypothetical protein
MASSRGSQRSRERKASRPSSMKVSTDGPPCIGSMPPTCTRLALEKGVEGPFHAIAEEGVTLRDIAETIGRRLNLPVASKTPSEAAEHSGWFAPFVGMDMPAASDRTRALLDWKPEQPGLLADLDQPAYLGD